MRTRATLVTALAALLLAGCGDHVLVLDVDVLSYLDPAVRDVAFGPVPAAPGGLASGEVALVDGAQVNLLQGVGSVADVRSATFRLQAVVHDSTGSGSDTLRVYLSDVAVDPRTTPAVIEEAVALTPGVSDTVDTQVPADGRVAQLFTKDKIRVTVTTSVRGPVSGAALEGRLNLGKLDVTVIAGRKTNL